MKLAVRFTPISLDTISPTDCIGLIFINEDGVKNIPKDIEDVQKSHQYFGNKPHHMHLLSVDSVDVHFADLLMDENGIVSYATEATTLHKSENKKLMLASTDAQFELPMISRSELSIYLSNQTEFVEIEDRDEDNYVMCKAEHSSERRRFNFPIKVPKCNIDGFVKFIPTKKEDIASPSVEYDIKKVTRFEVIDKKGRSYTDYNVKSIELSYQDDGRTLKIFIK